MGFLIMAINLVVLSGRLTADVELKATLNGVSVCSFNIASDSGYGEKKQTNFIKIVAWRNTAEFISKYFRKGSMIGIEGSIQTRKYTDKDGNNRTAFEVVANQAHFLESKNANGENASQNFAENTTPTFVPMTDEDGDLPF